MSPLAVMSVSLKSRITLPSTFHDSFTPAISAPRGPPCWSSARSSAS